MKWRGSVDIWHVIGLGQRVVFVTQHICFSRDAFGYTIPTRKSPELKKTHHGLSPSLLLHSIFQVDLVLNPSVSSFGIATVEKRQYGYRLSSAHTTRRPRCKPWSGSLANDTPAGGVVHSSTKGKREKGIARREWFTTSQVCIPLVPSVRLYHWALC